MDRVERMNPAAGFSLWTRARIRQPDRTPAMRLEPLEGRVLLAASPSIHLVNPSSAADVGTFVAKGMLTIGGSLIQGISARSGAAIIAGGGTIKVADSASPTNPAAGSGTTGATATNSAPAAGGTGATTANPPANTTGNATGTAGNPTNTAGNATNSEGNTTNSGGNATYTAGNATKTTSLATATNVASGSSSGNTGGGLPVVIGQLTLVNGTAATNPAPSGGSTAGPAPFPAIRETIAASAAPARFPTISETIGANVNGLLGAAAGAKAADGIAILSATIVALNNGTGPGAKAGDLAASAGSSVSASLSLIGTSGSTGLFNGQNGYPGLNNINSQSGSPAVAANLSAIAAAANIGNPAPNSIFVDPDQVLGKPQTITLDPFAGTRELPASTVLDSDDAPAPAGSADRAGGKVDTEFDFNFNFDVAVLPDDQAVPAPVTESTMLSASVATGPRDGLAETGLLTTSGSFVSIDPAQGGNARCSVSVQVVMTSMLATYSANLAFGGALSKARTMSWAARHWPATRRWNGAARPSAKLRSR
jgi:hypothetical protein